MNSAESWHGDHVFAGAREGNPLSNMALLMILRRMGRSTLNTHGFRSTLSDWCAERTAFAAEDRERALARAVGDKVEAAYRGPTAATGNNQARAALGGPIGMACGRTISPGTANFRELRSKMTAPAHLTLAAA